MGGSSEKNNVLGFSALEKPNHFLKNLFIFLNQPLENVNISAAW